MALQGFFRSLPVVYSADGCVEAIGQMLSRHFREPIALHNIALQDSNLVFGGGEIAQKAIELAISRHQPDLIALIGTSLTEMVGEDIESDVKLFMAGHSAAKEKLFLSLRMPDYEGSFETGYAGMTKRIVEAGIGYLDGGATRKKRRNRINLLAGPHLTPGDVMVLKEIAASFGLEVLALPDLSSSLCGHMLVGHTKLSRGGVPIEFMSKMLTAAYTLAVGGCMEETARLLEQYAGIPFHIFPCLTGLQAVDDFFRFLLEFTQHEVQVKYRWERQILLDCMLDARSAFRGKRILATLEPEHLLCLSGWLDEIGVGSFCAVSPVSSPVLDRIKGTVLVGDLEDAEHLAMEGTDLWIGSSLCEPGARRCGVAFEPLGFPVFGRIGTALTVSAGYSGTSGIVSRIGNKLLEVERSG